MQDTVIRFAFFFFVIVCLSVTSRMMLSVDGDVNACCKNAHDKISMIALTPNRAKQSPQPLGPRPEATLAQVFGVWMDHCESFQCIATLDTVSQFSVRSKEGKANDC